tara:strand:- start:28461 stop:28652 length:192 start_codon:yes stop_codon:yes gene_type:complete
VVSFWRAEASSQNYERKARPPDSYREGNAKNPEKAPRFPLINRKFAAILKTVNIIIYESSKRK